jgi:hypothetical protein
MDEYLSKFLNELRDQYGCVFEPQDPNPANIDNIDDSSGYERIVEKQLDPQILLHAFRACGISPHQNMDEAIDRGTVIIMDELASDGYILSIQASSDMMDVYKAMQRSN